MSLKLINYLFNSFIFANNEDILDLSIKKKDNSKILNKKPFKSFKNIQVYNNPYIGISDSIFQQSEYKSYVNENSFSEDTNLLKDNESSTTESLKEDNLLLNSLKYNEQESKEELITNNIIYINPLIESPLKKNSFNFITFRFFYEKNYEIQILRKTKLFIKFKTNSIESPEYEITKTKLEENNNEMKKIYINRIVVSKMNILNFKIPKNLKYLEIISEYKKNNDFTSKLKLKLYILNNKEDNKIDFPLIEIEKEKEIKSFFKNLLDYQFPIYDFYKNKNKNKSSHYFGFSIRFPIQIHSLLTINEYINKFNINKSYFEKRNNNNNITLLNNNKLIDKSPTTRINYSIGEDMIKDAVIFIINSLNNINLIINTSKDNSFIKIKKIDLILQSIKPYFREHWHISSFYNHIGCNINNMELFSFYCFFYRGMKYILYYWNININNKQ